MLLPLWILPSTLFGIFNTLDFFVTVLEKHVFFFSQTSCSSCRYAVTILSVSNSPVLVLACTFYFIIIFEFFEVIFVSLDAESDNFKRIAYFKSFNGEPTTSFETAEIPSASLEMKGVFTASPEVEGSVSCNFYFTGRKFFWQKWHLPQFLGT